MAILQVATPTPMPNGGDWFFQNQPPAEIVWIGVALAVIGIIMSALTLIDKIWGGPTLKVGFSHVMMPDAKVFGGHIQNMPLRNRILRALVLRPDVAILAFLTIAEVGGKRLVSNQRIPLDDEMVRSTIIRKTFVVGSVGARGAVYIDYRGPDKKELPLPEGEYIVAVSVVTDYTKVPVGARRLTIRDDIPFASDWEYESD